jgi:hypothetical protein
MHEVVIRSAKDLQSARVMQLLQSSAGLPPGDARRVVERILRGDAAEVSARSAQDARLLAAALARLGAAAQLKANADGECG